MEDFYRKLMDATNHKNTFMLHNGIRVLDVAKDYASASCDLTARSLNAMGSAHGGMLFTLADCAAGAAARSDGRGYVTLDCSMHFLRGAQEGTLTANATVIKRGRAVCVVESVVEGNGKELFKAEFTFYCTGESFAG